LAQMRFFPKKKFRSEVPFGKWRLDFPDRLKLFKKNNRTVLKVFAEYHRFSDFTLQQRAKRKCLKLLFKIIQIYYTEYIIQNTYSDNMNKSRQLE